MVLAYPALDLARSADTVTVPLVVRRAGVFEKTMFAATATVGLAGLALPEPISGALEAVLGEPVANLYFGLTMIVPGLAGLGAVRRSQRMRTPHEIEIECRTESLSLVGLALAWAGFAIVAGAAGWRAVAVTIVFVALSTSCVLRVLEIRHDLRKLHKALESGPNPADPPPLGEGG